MRAFNEQHHVSMGAEELGANIQEVQRLVRTMEADLGLVIGPGAERLYIVDETGAEVPLEKALLLYVKLVAQTGRREARRSSCRSRSRTSRRTLAEPVRGRGGAHQGVAARPSRRRPPSEDVVFAGSLGGGYIFPRFLPAFDAVMSLGKLLELLAPQARPLSEQLPGDPHEHARPQDGRVPLGAQGHRDAHGDRAPAARGRGRRRRARPRRRHPARRAGGWVQLLPDADEPVFHVYAEGADQPGLRAPRRGLPRGRARRHPGARRVGRGVRAANAAPYHGTSWTHVSPGAGEPAATSRRGRLRRFGAWYRSHVWLATALLLVVLLAAGFVALQAATWDEVGDGVSVAGVCLLGGLDAGGRGGGGRAPWRARVGTVQLSVGTDEEPLALHARPAGHEARRRARRRARPLAPGAAELPLGLSVWLPGGARRGRRRSIRVDAAAYREGLEAVRAGRGRAGAGRAPQARRRARSPSCPRARAERSTQSRSSAPILASLAAGRPYAGPVPDQGSSRPRSAPSTPRRGPRPRRSTSRGRSRCATGPGRSRSRPRRWPSMLVGQQG